MASQPPTLPSLTNSSFPFPPPPPTTLTPLPPLLPPIPDSWVLLALPIITYWSLSLFFHFLDTYNLLSRYRLHTPEEVLKRNHVTRREVIRDVVLQHIVQTIVGGITAFYEPTEMVGREAAEVFALYTRFLSVERWMTAALGVVGINGAALEEKVVRGVVGAGGGQLLNTAMGWLGLGGGPADWKLSVAEFVYWYILPAVRIWFAIFVLDTWQYFLHRLMHESKWLYKTFHSRHHRLYVPFAFGALYNHWFEGLLMDTIGAGLGYKLSGMGIRGGMIFFSFSTMKTVDDHCGYALPWDPLQKIFWNNAGYHDVHHQSWGIKTNYSQPFLICWDRWLGTQWTGGDASARYAASRERAAAAVERDRVAALLPPQKDDITNSHVNGHTTTNGGVAAMNGKVREGRKQVGETVVREEAAEERRAQAEVESLRRSTRRRTTRIAA
ncbi:fatty acid hydroxylase superfamily-domain-containing protein [Tricharina praecox]|uniref:fatty acid hydroxylase superfamily-domain-containing protein n=1 Tax=Tricharina praecox TaxID=43433 RepID=UPI00221E6B0C|nr:fatty acid hydroxylase superfamily-domain-containing protein [Tricharina praecox]KAI5855191.1 fatty acid hydroxylase superfamily-domain-containing protein [Tricharina praecox]